MQYKTITLEFLQGQPALYEVLRMNGMVLQTLDQYATALKASHEFWTEQLKANRPASDPRQLASEAMEIALQEMQDSLGPETPADDETAETLSLEAAMRFVRRYTPPA